MPEYLCKSCVYSTTNLTKFNRHLHTLKHHKIHKNSQKVYQEKGPCEKSIFKVSSIEGNTTIYPKNIKSSSIMVSTPDIDSNRFVCHYCNKCFKYLKGLNRHIKYYCKINEDESFQELANLLNEKDKQIENNEKILNENKEEIEKLQKMIEKLTNKLQIKHIHNGDNNFNNTVNFNVLNYNKTDYEHLTDKDYIKCIQDCNHCVKALIEKVHFNINKPENMNIYISSLKGRFIMVYRDNKWQVKNRKEQIDNLYECNELVLENWFEDYHEKYPHIISSFHRYLKNKDNDDDLMSKVKDEILLMLYNKRDIVIENRNRQKCLLYTT